VRRYLWILDPGIWTWDFGKEESLAVHAKVRIPAGLRGGRKETSCFTDHPGYGFYRFSHLRFFTASGEDKRVPMFVLSVHFGLQRYPCQTLVFAPPLRTRTSSSWGCGLN
jgi:hypothetical protein